MIEPGRSYSAGNQYRYGFNGKELDNEISGQGNQYDYGFRIYNPRLGRFLSVDPLAKEYPWNSAYAFAENDVIRCIDLDGSERIIVIYNEQKQVIKKIDFYDAEEGTHGSLGYGTIHSYADKTVYEEDGTTKILSNKPQGMFYLQKAGGEIARDTIGRAAYNIFTRNYIDKRIAGRTPAEKYVFRNDVLKTHKIIDIPDKAIAIGAEISKVIGEDAHNASPDAIRHGLWNVMMAKETDATFAKKVSDAHEQDSPDQPIGEKLMDLHNNSVGLELYQQNSGKSLQELYEMLIDKTAAGELLIYNSTTKETSKSSLTPDQVKNLKAIKIDKVESKGKINNY